MRGGHRPPRRPRRGGHPGLVGAVAGLLLLLGAAPRGAGGLHGHTPAHARHSARGPHAGPGSPASRRPPHLTKLFPDKGHVVGGTAVTLFGGGFARGPELTVRFSHESGEVDEERATWLDSGRIRVITPARHAAHVAHVAVANDGRTFSSFPLVTDDAGKYLQFRFVDTNPLGAWVLDNVTGPVEGGTWVTVRAYESLTSTRMQSGVFLPAKCTVHDRSLCLGDGGAGPPPHGADLPYVERAGIKHVGYSVQDNPIGTGPNARGLRCKFGNTSNSTRAVEAEWVNYGTIRCQTPPWDQVTDDDPTVAGNQVTLYVSNDGEWFTPGTQTPGDGDIQAFPGVPVGVAGTGATFTYYDEDGWIDNHTFAGGGMDDIAVSGAFNGDGVGFYEVAVDGLFPETFKWRFHPGAYNATSYEDFDTFVALEQGSVELSHDIFVAFADGDTSGSEVCSDGSGPFVHADPPPPGGGGAELYGLDPRRPGPAGGAEFYGLAGERRTCRQAGDRWVFRVGGGVPAVYEATTTHGEGHFAARGPFEGNTELTIVGNNFLPSKNLKCLLYDDDTNVTHVIPAHYDTPTQVRCITKHHEPLACAGPYCLPGAKRLATIRPCFHKFVQVTNNGRDYSAQRADVVFLYCDVYVSPEGSDTAGRGTPDRPYRTIAKGVDAALGRPRVYWKYKSGVGKGEGGRTALTGTEIRGPSTVSRRHFGRKSLDTSNKGYAYWVNRDRIMLADGVYQGTGNVGLHPRGKMLEAVAETFGQATINCEDTGMGAVTISAERTQGEEAAAIGMLSLTGVPNVNCEQTVHFPTSVLKSARAYPKSNRKVALDYPRGPAAAAAAPAEGFYGLEPGLALGLGGGQQQIGVSQFGAVESAETDFYGFTA